MQYLGGKSRIAKQIAQVMCAETSLRKTYMEPFLGGGVVAAVMAPRFDSAVLGDASPDLMRMWTAINEGWIPPDCVSEEEYYILKNAPVSALRGFVGYGCSFGGKFFAGYARNARGDNYARQSSSGIMRKYRAMSSGTGNLWFGCLDYRDWTIEPGSVVFCDPPYAGTTKYANTPEFDSNEFWRIMAEWAEHSSVFVSEYHAPDGWVPVWSGTPQASLGLVDQTARVNEVLWVRE